MAFRTRRRFRRFARRGPSARVSKVWSTTLFTNTAVAPDGVAASYQGLHSAAEGAWLPGVTPVPTQTIKRIIFRGGLIPVPLTTTFARNQFHVIGALMIIDEDDTDALINTTTRGTILAGGVDRLLWVGSFSGLCVEAPSSLNPPQVQPAWPVEIDIRGSWKIKEDQQLLLGWQTQVDVTQSMSSIVVSGISRVLVQHG